MLSQGSVTIATPDLVELGTLLALLEVDFGRAAGVKRKGTNGDLETPPTQLLLNMILLQLPLLPQQPPQ